MEHTVRDNAPAITFEGIYRSFKAAGRIVKALDDVSVSVRAGIITGLIGPDAAGKTTFMRLASGLLRPDSGRITVMGVDAVASPLEVQRQIGYMPQRFGLYEDLTVMENLELYSDLQGVTRQERPERYEELLQMTGLGPFTKRLAGRLSGGMKQKLGLACTLVSRPGLLILDEPTVGVDPVSRRDLWEIVYRLVGQEDVTVLLSTAYLDEAERCGEVILMHDGRTMGQGTPASFSSQVAGRGFQASVPGMSKRALQERLTRAQGVQDAIIHGDGVRFIMREGVPADTDALLPGLPGAAIEPVQPRFEDAFIVIVGGKAPDTPEASGSTGQGPGTSPPGGEVAPDNQDVITIRDVKRRFGDFYAVKGISFSVRRGEVFGLLGANGAGKSTTFRMLCGLLPASEGKLLVAGRDLRKAAAGARGRIGYMAQRFSLYSNLTVRENLKFFSSAYGLHGESRNRRIEWAVEEFGLARVVDATSGELPLGYKQRLALAAALMHEPDILFLDEPTSGVDPLARREFWRRINTLAEGGVTVLVTTHFMEEAEYCDRLVVMADGEVLAEGTPDEMKARFVSEAMPSPGMEDAFIGLIESRASETVVR